MGSGGADSAPDLRAEARLHRHRPAVRRPAMEGGAVLTALSHDAIGVLVGPLTLCAVMVGGGYAVYRAMGWDRIDDEDDEDDSC